MSKSKKKTFEICQLHSEYFHIQCFQCFNQQRCKLIPLYSVDSQTDEYGQGALAGKTEILQYIRVSLLLLPPQTPIDCSEMKRGIRDKQPKTTIESRADSRIRQFKHTEGLEISSRGLNYVQFLSEFANLRKSTISFILYQPPPPQLIHRHLI